MTLVTEFLTAKYVALDTVLGASRGLTSWSTL